MDIQRLRRSHSLFSGYFFVYVVRTVEIKPTYLEAEVVHARGAFPYPAGYLREVLRGERAWGLG